jgi:hypothetical protein
MTTPAQNDFLTRTGPRTPMGLGQCALPSASVR